MTLDFSIAQSFRSRIGENVSFYQRAYRANVTVLLRFGLFFVIFLFFFNGGIGRIAAQI